MDGAVVPGSRMQILSISCTLDNHIFIKTDINSFHESNACALMKRVNAGYDNFLYIIHIHWCVLVYVSTLGMYEHN